MNAVDFEYDGQFLSDFGYIICDFDAPSGANAITAGSHITFNKTPMQDGKKHALTSTKYEECITSTFDICRDPDKYDDMEISIDDFRDLMRWLNRREFLPFQIHDDDLDYEACYYDASFNIEKIRIHEKLYGLRLNMETNRPFGYGAKQTFELTFSDTSSSKFIDDISDEIGSVYPDMTITCSASGNLSIHNELFDCTTTINNCVNGEVITIKGDEQIITTTESSHAIYDDFNYEFLRIGNTYSNRRNRITVTSPCVLEISYLPAVKDIL